MNEKKVQKFVFEPRKSLGQNFLTSPLHLSRIADNCEIDNDTNVIEIGPGYGALTRHILKRNPRRMVCIEKDPNLSAWLNSNLRKEKTNLEIVLADALEVDWESLVESFGDGQKITILGNLPYNISNELITKLVRQKIPFQKIVFLVQKEVAQRWVANPFHYKNKYSSLSVTLNYLCETKLLLEVPKRFFNPSPPVDGAVVSFELKKTLPAGIPLESFFIFVKNCFRFRRKTLLNNLKSFREKEEKVRGTIAKLELDEKVRPQDLSIDQYIKLFKII